MFKIALRNIFRNKRRTALTGGVIALAVMLAIFLWSFISGVVDGMFDNMIRLTNGHIRILNEDYVKREKMLPLEANIQNYQEVEKIAQANPNVTYTAGRIKFGVLLDYKGRNKPVLGTGVVPKTESKISRLDQKIVEGRMIRIGEEEINIGERLAQELGLKLGDTLTIVTQTAYGSITAMNLKIVGLFSYGVPSVDRTTFYLPLDKTQELLDLDNPSTELGAGAVTEIFIIVKDMNKAPEVAKEIRTRLQQIYPGQYTTKSWQEMGILFLYMGLAKRIYGSIYFMILFLASFTIFNTMFMAVMERAKEIGMMKSLGMKNRQVVGIILLEATAVGVIFGFIGSVAGGLLAYWGNVYGIDYTSTFEAMKGTFNLPISYVYRTIVSWKIIAFGFCMGILFSVIAAIPPALRAAQMEPTEALREI